jgi:glutaredoxin
MIGRKHFFYCLFVLIILGITACLGGPAKYDSFAQCLTEKGVIMYGTGWCSHCKNQKNEFGSSFQYVDYVDCDRYKSECLKAGVKGYPTWVIEGVNYPGEQPLYKLASLSGCDLD